MKREEAGMRVQEAGSAAPNIVHARSTGCATQRARCILYLCLLRARVVALYVLSFLFACTCCGDNELRVKSLKIYSGVRVNVAT